VTVYGNPEVKFNGNKAKYGEAACVLQDSFKNNV